MQKLFGHPLLELPQIPRERVALQTLISATRRQIKRSRLMRWAALNFIGWGLIILSSRCGAAAAVPVEQVEQVEQFLVYLPVLFR